MKLNMDCIREILLWIEENQKMDCGDDNSLNGNVRGIWSRAIPKFNGYADDDILYSIKQMVDGRLLDASIHKDNNISKYFIKDITPAGHEFLENIRSDNNWNKTKSVASEVGSFALSVLTKIASSVIAEGIKKTMGLG